jgi:hypothetical protein
MDFVFIMRCLVVGFFGSCLGGALGDIWWFRMIFGSVFGFCGC